MLQWYQTIMYVRFEKCQASLASIIYSTVDHIFWRVLIYTLVCKTSVCVLVTSPECNINLRGHDDASFSIREISWKQLFPKIWFHKNKVTYSMNLVLNVICFINFWVHVFSGATFPPIHLRLCLLLLWCVVQCFLWLYTLEKFFCR